MKKALGKLKMEFIQEEFHANTSAVIECVVFRVFFSLNFRQRAYLRALARVKAAIETTPIKTSVSAVCLVSAHAAKDELAQRLQSIISNINKVQASLGLN